MPRPPRRPPLGADPRPSRAPQTAGLVVDQFGVEAGADTALICATPDHASDIVPRTIPALLFERFIDAVAMLRHYIQLS